MTTLKDLILAGAAGTTDEYEYRSTSGSPITLPGLHPILVNLRGAARDWAPMNADGKRGQLRARLLAARGPTPAGDWLSISRYKADSVFIQTNSFAIAKAALDMGGELGSVHAVMSGRGYTRRPEQIKVVR